jgi:hypothetical protein
MRLFQQSNTNLIIRPNCDFKKTKRNHLEVALDAGTAVSAKRYDFKKQIDQNATSKTQNKITWR